MTSNCWKARKLRFDPKPNCIKLRFPPQLLIRSSRHEKEVNKAETTAMPKKKEKLPATSIKERKSHKIREPNEVILAESKLRFCPDQLINLNYILKKKLERVVDLEKGKWALWAWPFLIYLFLIKKNRRP